MLGLLAGEAADGGNHAAVKLQVVVAVKNVVLAVVLVVQGHFHARQALPKLGTGVGTTRGAGVGVPAPVHVGLGKIGVAVPVLFVDKRQNTCAVATRRGPKNAVAGALLGFLGGHVLSVQLGKVAQVVLTHEVLVERLVEGQHKLHGIIQ